MKKRIYSCLLMLVMSVCAPQVSNVQANILHPFFVSVTELNFNPKNNNLEISCKMFVDDLQNALKQNYKRPIDLANEKQESENNIIINDYLTKHLSIIADAKAVGLKFVGFEKESESVYCYFEAANISSPKKIIITNKILHDYKQEQVNIMHVVVNGSRKSTKTDLQTNQASLNF
ncbi:MAG TPA: DUF6702 family protein [Segetibacter sp.]